MNYDRAPLYDIFDIMDRVVDAYECYGYFAAHHL